jgi:hypothetical protein
LRSAIKKHWDIFTEVFGQKWLRIPGTALAVLSLYDLFLSQGLSEDFAKKWPRLHEVFSMTGGWLPWWAWGWIATAFATIVIFEYAVRLQSRLATTWPDKRFAGMKKNAGRDEFANEEVLLADLLREGSLLSGKTFSRCLIKGPAFLKLQNQNTLEFCSAENPKQCFLTVPEGSPIIGSVTLSRNIFKECFFDRITFIGTLQDTLISQHGVDPMPISVWRTNHLEKK